MGPTSTPWAQRDLNGPNGTPMGPTSTPQTQQDPNGPNQHPMGPAGPAAPWPPPSPGRQLCAPRAARLCSWLLLWGSAVSAPPRHGKVQNQTHLWYKMTYLPHFSV